ncbi:translation machinery-associated protein 20 [Savitreella phatthalungensis]
MSLFAKFSSKADIKSTTPVKSSAQRNIKSRLVETYSELGDSIDDVIPKKSQLQHVKCEDRVSLYSLDGDVLFFQHFDEQLIPTLKLVHLYPKAFPTVRVDKGAVRFVLSGANIMTPGLTSAGGQLPEDLPANSIVIIAAEGKEHALAIGKTNMSAAEMREKNKGIAMDSLHYLGDWLWKLEL